MKESKFLAKGSSTIEDLVGRNPLRRCLVDFFGDKEVIDFFDSKKDQCKGWEIGDVVKIRKPDLKS